MNKLTVSKTVCNIHNNFVCMYVCMYACMYVCIFHYNARRILDRLHLVCPNECKYICIFYSYRYRTVL